MKTKAELSALKSEVNTLNKKLAELNEEELVQVTGGGKYIGFVDSDDYEHKETYKYASASAREDYVHPPIRGSGGGGAGGGSGAAMTGQS